VTIVDESDSNGGKPRCCDCKKSPALRVYRILKKDGCRASIVQNPTTSLADDVAVTKRVIEEQKGPVILVGHSYGGAVTTEAGTDPSVIGLVYITRLPLTGVSRSPR
jgi:hypothetical protein